MRCLERREGNTTQQKDKATQRNSPKAVIFQRAASGGTHIHVHDLIIHEMLRKKGKATQHNRKTKQHNTTQPRQLFFKELPRVGHTYMLVYPGDAE